MQEIQNHSLDSSRDLNDLYSENQNNELGSFKESEASQSINKALSYQIEVPDLARAESPMQKIRESSPEEILEPTLTPKDAPSQSLMEGLHSFQVSLHEKPAAPVEAKPERKGSFESDSVQKKVVWLENEMKKIAIQMKQLQTEKLSPQLPEDLSESQSLALRNKNEQADEAEKQMSFISENLNNESQRTTPLPINDIFRTELNFMAQLDELHLENAGESGEHRQPVQSQSFSSHSYIDYNQSFILEKKDLASSQVNDRADGCLNTMMASPQLRDQSLALSQIIKMKTAEKQRRLACTPLRKQNLIDGRLSEIAAPEEVSMDFTSKEEKSFELRTPPRQPSQFTKNIAITESPGPDRQGSGCPVLLRQTPEPLQTSSFKPRTDDTLIRTGQFRSGQVSEEKQSSTTFKHSSSYKE